MQKKLVLVSPTSQRLVELFGLEYFPLYCEAVFQQGPPDPIAAVPPTQGILTSHCTPSGIGDAGHPLSLDDVKGHIYGLFGWLHKHGLL